SFCFLSYFVPDSCYPAYASLSSNRNVQIGKRGRAPRSAAQVRSPQLRSIRETRRTGGQASASRSNFQTGDKVCLNNWPSYQRSILPTLLSLFCIGPDCKGRLRIWK